MSHILTHWDRADWVVPVFCVELDYPTFLSLCNLACDMMRRIKGVEGFQLMEIIALDNEQSRVMTNITHNHSDTVKFVTHVHQSSVEIGPGSFV